MMAQPPLPQRQIPDGGRTLTLEVVRDRRLKAAAHFRLEQDTIRVRVPSHLSVDQVERVLDDIVARVIKQRQRARKQNDIDLDQRAHDLNRLYFDGELRWHTIRWVSNMQRRLGSCSAGGTTDGDIRISDSIRTWPAYVVDYILAHELAHRKYPDHSPAFWAYLARYPHTERARGFIEGVAYAQGQDPESMI
ncbi:MAG: M48 family metallopeptidase [Chloroflexi bacterium]|nr:M48 family metallopeptidase [Chloroflexota bacterium]